MLAVPGCTTDCRPAVSPVAPAPLPAAFSLFRLINRDASKLSDVGSLRDLRVSLRRSGCRDIPSGSIGDCRISEPIATVCRPETGRRPRCARLYYVKACDCGVFMSTVSMLRSVFAAKHWITCPFAQYRILPCFARNRSLASRTRLPKPIALAAFLCNSMQTISHCLPLSESVGTPSLPLLSPACASSPGCSSSGCCCCLPLPTP